MRYSSSVLSALVISFFVFLGMAALASAPQYKKSIEIEMVSFSKVRDMKQPVVKEVKKKEPPKQVKVKQPPAVPHLDVAHNPDRSELFLTKAGIDNKDLNLLNLEMPSLANLNGDIGSVHLEGDLMTKIMISPMYPRKALISKVEGWVKVEFTVNMFGKVSNAKVIDSKPSNIFDRETLKAVYKAVFKPLVVNGKAIPQRAIQVFEFKLPKK